AATLIMIANEGYSWRPDEFVGWAVFGAAPPLLAVAWMWVMRDIPSSSRLRMKAMLMPWVKRLGILFIVLIGLGLMAVILETVAG
ncbi:MAG: hypothetical protein O7C67_15065, partial [Gammaproteobacteria bacterium]|nr:hypothetical protein [Gammaproteobacteria bacterium]